MPIKTKKTIKKEKVISEKPKKKVIKKVTPSHKKEAVQEVIPEIIKEPVKIHKAIEHKPVKDAGIWSTGKRKTAIARIQLFKNGNGEITVNNKSFKDYFPYFELQNIVLSPLCLTNQEKSFNFRIMIKGGGFKSQAEAVRLGISQALVALDPECRKTLKTVKFLTRDSRVKERKKPGLKRARRAPQWNKR